MEKTSQHLESLWSHLAKIPSVEGLWLGDVRELETNKSGVLVELLLLLGCQFSKHFLNAEKLINF